MAMLDDATLPALPITHDRVEATGAIPLPRPDRGLSLWVTGSPNDEHQRQICTPSNRQGQRLRK